MDASAIMTRAVVTVTPDTAVSEMAKIMVDKRISTVPVVDDGAVVGIITEGDLLGRAEIGTEHRRSRWLELVLSNLTLARDYVREHGRKASDVMTRNVITVDPATLIVEIANILESHHIKRVPVVANGALVGIVSRANLIQALASSESHRLSTGTPQDRGTSSSLMAKCIYGDTSNRRQPVGLWSSWPRTSPVCGACTTTWIIRRYLLAAN